MGFALAYKHLREGSRTIEMKEGSEQGIIENLKHSIVYIFLTFSSLGIGRYHLPQM
jgi:hypothetical protein